MALINLSPIVKNMLLARLQNEYEAHVFYRNASNYCEVSGYTKAAKYYADEAESELEHAKKIQTFLNNWNVSYSLPSISAVQEFAGFSNLIQKQYDIEAQLYLSYQNNANEVETLDRSAYNLILEMVQIQYVSVAEVRTLLDKLNLYNNDKTGLKLFEQEAF